MKGIVLFTDGACKGNPGCGGWGFVLCRPDGDFEACGHIGDTTNNRAELTAVIEGLNSIIDPSEVRVLSDSKYVVDSMTNGWVEQWKKRGWKNRHRAGGVPNRDLWAELLDAVGRHESVKFEWVKGHAGTLYNEHADQLASRAACGYSLRMQPLGGLSATRRSRDSHFDAVRL